VTGATPASGIELVPAARGMGRARVERSRIVSANAGSGRSRRSRGPGVGATVRQLQRRLRRLPDVGSGGGAGPASAGGGDGGGGGEPGRRSPRPPRGGAAAARGHPPRRGPRGRVLLAPAEGEPRGAGLPRGGKCLRRVGPRPDPAAPREALRGDGRPPEGDRRRGPVPQGRLALLHPHGKGEPVRDPLPEARLARGRGAGRARPERPRARPVVLRPRLVHGQRQRPAPGLLHRHLRLPPVRAAGEGPHDGGDVPGPGGADRLGRLGGGQRDPFLHRRGRRQAAVPALSPPARDAGARADLRGARRELLDRGLPRAFAAVPLPGAGEPHHERVACARRRPARGRVADDRGAAGGDRVLRRRRPGALPHPGERHRPQLPPGHGAARPAGEGELDRGDPGAPRRDAGGGRALRAVLRPL